MQYDDPANAPEYYDLARDPLERRNIYPSLSNERKAELAARLAALRACSGGASCHEADAGP